MGANEGIALVDFKSLNDALLNRAEYFLANWLPDGRRVGGEWKSRNPERSDKHEGSFSVNINTGVWADFATDDKGSDLVSLYAYVKGKGQAEAGRDLSEQLCIPAIGSTGQHIGAGKRGGGKPKSPLVPIEQRAARASKTDWEPIQPVPTDAGDPPVAHISRGRPEHIWTYRNAAGEVLGYIHRYRTSSGGKEMHPVVYAAHPDGRREWRWMIFREPRPLYGLDRLARWPSARVVLVEGEKCADAGQELFKSAPWVTWPGGVNAINKIDWSPLAGREVILWPDADSQREKPPKNDPDRVMPFLAPEKQPGWKAMRSIAERLVALDCKVKIVTLPEPGTLPNGWDVADAVADGWDHGRIRAFLASEAKRFGGDDPVPPHPLDDVGRGGADTFVDDADGGNPPPPPPYEAAEPVAVDLEHMLKHWALIYGGTDVWDALEMMRMKQAGARALVGKKLLAEWQGHPSRRWIKPEAVQAQIASRHPPGGGGVLECLERYVLLYGTTDVWDDRHRSRMGLDALKASVGGTTFKLWLEHPEKRQILVQNLCFDPTQRVDPETHINMFEGLPLRPDPDQSKCVAIRDLLAHLCLGEGPVAYEWLLKWLSYQVQHVGAKMVTSVIMHGDTQGTGKSMFWEGVYKPLFGVYAATMGQGQLESGWTEWKSRKLFVLFEEILNRNDKYSHLGELKHSISGKTHRINKKFMSEWEESNHLNMAFLSNEHQPIPVEPADRRFLVIWTQDKLPEEQQRAVEHEIAHGGIEAFYHFLLTYDVGDFGPHTKPPMTNAKERLIDFGLPGWELFYRAWVAKWIDYAPYVSCRSADLYRAYRRFCEQSGERALPENKVTNMLGTRVPRRVERYMDVTGEKQARMFVVGECPEGKRRSVWLAEQMAVFSGALRNQREIDG